MGGLQQEVCDPVIHPKLHGEQKGAFLISYIQNNDTATGKSNLFLYFAFVSLTFINVNPVKEISVLPMSTGPSVCF